jgi:hypothetical protein
MGLQDDIALCAPRFARKQSCETQITQFGAEYACAAAAAAKKPQRPAPEVVRQAHGSARA